MVDSIFKPFRKVVGSVAEIFLKPLAKKALKSGVEHAGDKLGKKAAEKSGDLNMKKLHGMQTRRAVSGEARRSLQTPRTTTQPILKTPAKPESTDDYINRLLSK